MTSLCQGKTVVLILVRSQFVEGIRLILKVLKRQTAFPSAAIHSRAVGSQFETCRPHGEAPDGSPVLLSALALGRGAESRRDACRAGFIRRPLPRLLGAKNFLGLCSLLCVYNQPPSEIRI